MTVTPGARFAAIRAELARRGARDPAALAATIGRRKLGKAKFQAAAAAGRRRANLAAAVSKHPESGRYQTHGAPMIDETQRRKRTR